MGMILSNFPLHGTLDFLSIIICEFDEENSFCQLTQFENKSLITNSPIIYSLIYIILANNQVIFKINC